MAASEEKGTSMRHRDTSFANFGLRRKNLAKTRDISKGICMPGRTTPVELFISSNPRVGGQIVYSCIKKMNSPQVDDQALCSYYTSFMLAFVPGLRDAFKTALSLTGCQVTVLTGEPGAPFEGTVELGESFSPRVCLMYFGQGVLLLFKNTSSQICYDNLMRNQLSVMGAVLGVSPNERISIMLDHERAEVIRIVMGSNQLLRKRLFSYIQDADNFKDPFGALCEYLCNILAWTGMTEITCIVETLLITNSPILRDLRVANEVRNLEIALREINNSNEDPEYFCILESPLRTWVLEQVKCPTLIDVAQLVKINQDPSMSTQKKYNPVVLELVAKHKQYLGGTNDIKVPTIIDYIRNFNNLK